MRILIQHPHGKDEISGVLTSIDEMMPELLARQGVEVQLLSTRESTMWQQIAAVRRADAVMLNSNSLAMTLAARLFRRPSLLKLHYVQYHTVHIDCAPMPFGKRIRTELRYFLGLKRGTRYFVESIARLVMRTAVGLTVHRVSACSHFCAEQCALPREVHVLRNPMRIAAGLPRRELSSLETPWRFAYAGRVTHDKGCDTLLEAAHEIARTRRDFRIDVIGDGPYLLEMKAQVAAHGLTEHFRFHGRLDSKGTLAVMAGALCAVMPSRLPETAGYVPIEAASRGVACIVSRMGGLTETAGPDCPSFTVGRADELAHIMMRFLDDPSQALAAGHAAYLRAQQLHSPKLIVDELLELVQSRRSRRRKTATAAIS